MGKVVERIKMLMSSGPPVTSQLRLKSKRLIYHLLNRIGTHKNNYVQRKQSQCVDVDGISDICKHHFEYFVTLFPAKVIRGH